MKRTCLTRLEQCGFCGFRSFLSLPWRLRGSAVVWDADPRAQWFRCFHSLHPRTIACFQWICLLLTNSPQKMLEKKTMKELFTPVFNSLTSTDDEADVFLNAIHTWHQACVWRHSIVGWWGWSDFVEWKATRQSGYLVNWVVSKWSWARPIALGDPLRHGSLEISQAWTGKRSKRQRNTVDDHAEPELRKSMYL